MTLHSGSVPDRAKQLSQLRILVTRAEGQAEEFVQKLQALDATVICRPLITIAPPHSWLEFNEVLAGLSSFDWLLFASSNAVNSFFQRLQSQRIILDQQRTRIAAVGPATAKTITAHGWMVSYQPKTEFVAEGLIKDFPGYPELAGVRVLWPKTNIGRLLLADQLRRAGAAVTVVECYRTEAPANLDQLGADISTMLRNADLDAVTLTSAQTARNLATALQAHNSQPLFNGVSVIVIGPQTASAFASCFPGIPLREAHPYTTDGMIELLCLINAERTQV